MRSEVVIDSLRIRFGTTRNLPNRLVEKMVHALPRDTEAAGNLGWPDAARDHGANLSPAPAPVIELLLVCHGRDYRSNRYLFVKHNNFSVNRLTVVKA